MLRDSLAKTRTSVSGLSGALPHARGFARKLKFGPEMRALMLKGFDYLVNAVAVTLGPKGRNVIIEQPFDKPKITKDGLTVAKSIVLSNKYQNMGVKLMQNVAEETNEKAGDGTTTALVLARALARAAYEHSAKGVNARDIQSGLNLATEAIALQLSIMSYPVSAPSQIKQVASIAANGDAHVGELITEAINRVGKLGVITVEKSETPQDELEHLEGFRLEHGYISPCFINNSKAAQVKFSDAIVLLSECKISTAASILKAMEIASSAGKPLLVVAEDIEEEPLSIMVLNRLKLNMQLVAVKAPGFGESRRNYLNDLAIATGARVFDQNSKLYELQLSDFGRVQEVIISKNETLLLNCLGAHQAIENHISKLRHLLLATESAHEREKLQQRLARLKGGVAVIKVGGSSRLELQERRERVEDALNATRAAMAEGIVPGGGTALLRCVPVLDFLHADNADQRQGIEIVRRALSVPCLTIARNAGVDAAQVVQKVSAKTDECGYDARKNKFTNLVHCGIVDPSKVVRIAVEEAASVASLFLTTEALMVEDEL